MGRTIIQREQIMKVIERQGYFTVTWRWRDDYLRTMCRNLGLKKKWRKRGETGYDTFIKRTN